MTHNPWQPPQLGLPSLIVDEAAKRVATQVFGPRWTLPAVTDVAGATVAQQVFAARNQAVNSLAIGADVDLLLGLITTKGDLLTRDANGLARLGVGPDGSVTVADASQSTGLHSLTFSGPYFGSGADSSSTLGANTTLATALSAIRQYTTLDLVTYTFTGDNAADSALVLCCSTLLTGNGGSVVSIKHSGTATGGAARVQGGSSGAGGNGKGPNVGLFVFARKVSGTLTIDGNGENGTDGGNASGTPTGAQTGAAGGSASVLVMTVFNSGRSNCTANFGNGGAGGSATGGATIANSVTVQSQVWRDSAHIIGSARSAPGATVGDTVPGPGVNVPAFPRMCRTMSAPAGGSGGITNATANSGGGAGGGGASCGVYAGGAGGNGGAGAGTIGAGGGGGGGGTPGTVVGVMIGEFASGTTCTIRSNGGNGGNGGNAVSNGGGGGGGGGGAGGYVHAVLPVNYSNTATMTLTATKGTKGTKGNGAGTGANGSDGSDGTDGLVQTMTWFS